MPSTPNFADLLKNNEAPSDAEIQEVSELCAIARNNLLQIDTEIQRLQEKRAVIQKSIDSYTTILSPIRRLPTDILREIFYQCLHSTRNPIMSATEAPMLLTRVCSLWRSVALTSPNIWAELHIPHPGDPQTSLHYENLTGEDLHQTFSEVMRRRCQIVKEWLERSGSCFLSLSISYPHCDYFGGYNPESEVETDIFMHEIFQILVPFVRRWRRLDLSMPLFVYQQLQARIPSKAMLSNLRTLRVAINPKEPLSDGSVPPLLVLEAPNLRMLSVNASRLTHHAPKLLPTHTWGLLTDLCFDSLIQDRDLLTLLQACNCLVNCQINDVRPSFNTEPSASAVAVCLPHLEKLKIFEFSQSSPALRSIKAPSLTFFQYQNSKRPTSWPPQSGSGETMKWFIENSSSTLKTLAISPLDFRRETLPLLHLAVGVTHLHVFEQDKDPGFPWEIKFIDLSILKVEYPTSELGVLLPHLEVLEVNQICDIHDDELLQLFMSRVDASTRGDASPLKRVKLHLSRREQNDIVEKVLAYARSAGIEMKFEVSYPPVPPEPCYIRHLSPSFLLPKPLSLNPFS